MLAFAATALAASGLVRAEPVQVDVTFETREAIRHDFQDGSNRFLAMLHREGTAEGEGAFAGAQITEYGWHDVDPPHGADPYGFLVVTTDDGDVAYLKFDARADFLGGGDKPRLTNHGVWELVSGTGRFSDMTGLGTVVMTPGEQTKFSLNGELAPIP